MMTPHTNGKTPATAHDSNLTPEKPREADEPIYEVDDAYNEGSVELAPAAAPAAAAPTSEAPSEAEQARAVHKRKATKRTTSANAATPGGRAAGERAGARSAERVRAGEASAPEAATSGNAASKSSLDAIQTSKSAAVTQDLSEAARKFEQQKRSRSEKPSRKAKKRVEQEQAAKKAAAAPGDAAPEKNAQVAAATASEKPSKRAARFKKVAATSDDATLETSSEAAAQEDEAKEQAAKARRAQLHLAGTKPAATGDAKGAAGEELPAAGEPQAAVASAAPSTSETPQVAAPPQEAPAQKPFKRARSKSETPQEEPAASKANPVEAAAAAVATVGGLFSRKGDAAKGGQSATAPGRFSAAKAARAGKAAGKEGKAAAGARAGRSGRASDQPRTPLWERGWVRITAIVLVALVFTGAMLYEPAKNLWVAKREQDTLLATKALWESYSQEQRDRIAQLQSREGIMDEARRHGYVESGDTAVEVEGLNDGEEQTGEAVSPDDLGVTLREEDEPWYVQALDAIFGYSD